MAPTLGDSIGVFPRAVGFISGDFRNLKILRRRIDQSRKHLNVTRKLVVNLNGSDDIGFDAAHQMAFHPILLLFNRAVLEVKPAGKTTSRETGRIGGEVCLNRFQRQTALSYQGPENGSQIEILKIVGDAIKVRHLSDESATVRSPQIAN